MAGMSPGRWQRPRCLQRSQGLLLLLVATMGTWAALWSLYPPPPSNVIAEPFVPAEVSAMPPPRQVTRSLAELQLGLRRRGLSDFALLLSRMPLAGSELVALLLKWSQATNGFRLVSLPLPRDKESPPGEAGEARSLSPTEQEDLVAFVTDTLRKEALPVAFHGPVLFTNFSLFDRQSPAYISLVRDPVDKVVTRLHRTSAPVSPSQRSTPEDQLALLLSCIEDFRLRSECDPRDLSIPYFCGQDSRCMEWNSSWALSRAKINIETYFPVVGILEDLNKTFAVLESQVPLFFTGVQELYVNNLLDSQTSWSARRTKDSNPHLRYELARFLWRERDLYAWIKQRLMRQFHKTHERSSMSGLVGSDKMTKAFSVHKTASLIKH